MRVGRHWRVFPELARASRPRLGWERQKYGEAHQWYWRDLKFIGLWEAESDPRMATVGSPQVG